MLPPTRKWLILQIFDGWDAEGDDALTINTEGDDGKGMMLPPTPSTDAEGDDTLTIDSEVDDASIDAETDDASSIGVEAYDDSTIDAEA